MSRFFLSLALVLSLNLSVVSCSAEKADHEYSAVAEELIASRDCSGAIKVLRAGIYRFPDSYELNLLMGRSVLACYTDLTPQARSRYLSRHYLRRAEVMAPDTARREEARREYARVLELQRESR